MNVKQNHVALKVEHPKALIDNCTTVLVRLKSYNITVFRYFTFLMKTTGTVFLISDEQKNHDVGHLKTIENIVDIENKNLTVRYFVKLVLGLYINVYLLL